MGNLRLISSWHIIRVRGSWLLLNNPEMVRDGSAGPENLNGMVIEASKTADLLWCAYAYLWTTIGEDFKGMELGD